MKTLKKLFNYAALPLLFAAIPASNSHGDHSVGGRGGLPARIDAAFLEMLLNGDQGKQNVRDYLNLYKTNHKFPNERGAQLLDKLLANGLEADLASPYDAGQDPKCRDVFDSSTAAWAGLNEKGGKMCYDAPTLATTWASLAPEVTMLKLRALQIHEHAHHLGFEEEDANAVAAFTLLPQGELGRSPELISAARQTIRNSHATDYIATDGDGIARELCQGYLDDVALYAKMVFTCTTTWGRCYQPVLGPKVYAWESDVRLGTPLCDVSSVPTVCADDAAKNALDYFSDAFPSVDDHAPVKAAIQGIMGCSTYEPDKVASRYYQGSLYEANCLDGRVGIALAAIRNFRQQADLRCKMPAQLSTFNPFGKDK